MLEVTLSAACADMHAALTNPNARGNFNEDDIERLFHNRLVAIKAGFSYLPTLEPERT